MSSETLTPHFLFQHGTKTLYDYIMKSINAQGLTVDSGDSISVRCICGKRFHGAAWRTFLDLETHMLNTPVAEHKALHQLGTRIDLVEHGCRDENEAAPVTPDLCEFKTVDTGQACC